MPMRLADLAVGEQFPQQRCGRSLAELAAYLLNAFVERDRSAEQGLDRHRARQVCDAPEAMTLDNGESGDRSV